MVTVEVEDIPAAGELFLEICEERVVGDETDVSEKSYIRGCLFEGEGCV